MTTLRVAAPPPDDGPLSLDPPAGSLIAAHDLGTAVDTDVPRPTLGGFVYPGAVSTLIGEPGVGKSFVAAGLVAEAAALGRLAVILDHEDTPATWGRRLRGLGLSDETLTDRVMYLQPQGPFDDADLSWLGRLVGAMVDPLVIVDSSAENMAAHGLDEDAAPDVTAWFARVARPLARAGASVVLLDHTVKSKDRGRWARGSGAKLAAIDGCAVVLTAVEPFARGRSGVGELTVSKDRHGAVGPVGATVGTVHFSVLGDQVHAVTISRQDPGEHQGAGPQTIARPAEVDEGVGF